MTRGIERREIGRIAVIVVAALALLWLVSALTISTVLSVSQPALVLQWWPWSASAASREAARQLQDATNPRSLETPRRLSWLALSREPANAIAARNFGLIYALQNDEVRAERLFHYAERLSRRDGPTQMWLIETNVQHGNITGALQHYDRAMRTDLTSRDKLIPILVEAAQTPDVASALAKIVAQKPNWAPDFITALVSQSRGAEALARIVPAARLNPVIPAQRDQLAVALRHMVDLGAIFPAYRLYLASREYSQAARAPLRDGGFDGAGGLVPFEWQLATGEGHEAVREHVDGADGQVLSLYGNAGGEMARQLLLLAPGSYRIAVTAGAIPQDEAARPSLSLICAVGKPVVMANFKLVPDGGRPRRLMQGFAVPSGGCGAQWLFVTSGNLIDRDATAPWIDGLEITRSAGQVS